MRDPDVGDAPKAGGPGWCSTVKTESINSLRRRVAVVRIQPRLKAGLLDLMEP